MPNDTAKYRFYGELAAWWPLISACRGGSSSRQQLPQDPSRSIADRRSDLLRLSGEARLDSDQLKLRAVGWTYGRAGTMSNMQHLKRVVCHPE